MRGGRGGGGSPRRSRARHNPTALSAWVTPRKKRGEAQEVHECPPGKPGNTRIPSGAGRGAKSQGILRFSQNRAGSGGCPIRRCRAAFPGWPGGWLPPLLGKTAPPRRSYGIPDKAICRSITTRSYARTVIQVFRIFHPSRQDPRKPKRALTSAPPNASFSTGITPAHIGDR